MTRSLMPIDNVAGENAAEKKVCVDKFPTPVGTVKRATVNKSSIYYCYTNRGNFLYERIVGTGSFEDMAAHYSIVMADEERRAGVRVLIDHRFDLFDVSFEKIFELDRFLKSNYEKRDIHPGILVQLSNTDRSYGKTRMFESVAERGNNIIHSVRDVGQALDLLEIDPELLADVMAEIEKIVSAE